MEIKVLNPGDWALLKAARLRALADSPEAFLSSCVIEEQWGMDDWLRKFKNSIWAIVQQDGKVIGISRSVKFSHRPAWERYIESVWVAPTHRGLGIPRVLLNKLVEADPGAAEIKELWLWVLDNNDQARRTYTNLGFVPTGFVQPLADGSGRKEERWYFALNDGGGPA